MVRNMRRRTAASSKSGGMMSGTRFSRTRLARAPRLATAVKARSVEATRRRAKARRSGSEPSRSAACAWPCTTAADFHVGDVEEMVVGPTREADAEALAHARVRAVAAGEVGRLTRLVRSVRALQAGHHAPGVVLEFHELGATLDLDAERGQSVDQELLVLVLRIDQRVRLPT